MPFIPDDSQANINTFSSGFKPDISTPTSETARMQQSIDENGGLWGMFKSAATGIGKAITTSERALGNTYGGIRRTFGPETEMGSLDSLTKMFKDNEDNKVTVLQQMRSKRERGLDTSADERFLQSLEDTTKSLNEQIKSITDQTSKTTSQVAGELGGVALDLLSAGSYSGLIKGTKAASLLAKTGKYGEAAVDIGRGALTGYGYDVTGGLQQGETGAEAFKPGVGTVAGTLIPAAIWTAKATKALMQGKADRVVNSLVKPKMSEMAYGKNPGRAVAGEKIVANNLDDLGEKITERRQLIGKDLAESAQQINSIPNSKLDLSDTLSSIDEAMNKAASQNNKDLLRRLSKVRESITDDLVRDVKLPKEAIDSFVYNAPMQLERNGSTKLAEKIKNMDLSEVTTGSQLKQAIVDELGSDALNNPDVSNWLKTTINFVRDANPGAALDDIVSVGKTKLDDVDFSRALDIKRKVGELAAWTGNPSDDKLVNQAIKNTYGSIKDKLNTKATEVAPETASRFTKLNERYADLLSAEKAVKNRNLVLQRQNVISAPIKAGTIAGLIAAPFTGGMSLSTLLIGAGTGLIDKGLASTAVKTRIASWLTKETPVVIADVIKKNPKVLPLIIKSMSVRQNKVLLPAIVKLLSTPN